MASNQEITAPLRYWVDNERKRVVMAEASGHFVDVLFSFLTLPLGTIIRLGNTFGQPIEIGCINNLFKSVEALNPDVFWNDICKQMLLSPRNPLEFSYQRLKLKVDDTQPTKYFVCHICSKGSDFSLSTFDEVKCHCGNLMKRQLDMLVEPAGGNGVFVKGDAMFLIFDDLTVLRSSPSVSFKPPLQLGHKEFRKVEEKSLDVDTNKVFSILKQALTSKSALSVTLENGKSEPSSSFLPDIGPSRWKDSIKIKVIVSKSQNKILFVEADGDFVDFLVSFLTMPLGSIMYLVNGKLSLGSIDKLYTSVKNLDPSWLIASSTKSLLNPKVARHFGCGSNPLNASEEDTGKYWYGTGIVKDNRGRIICEKNMISKKKDMLKDPKDIKLLDPRSSDGARKSDVGFMKRPCLFVVSDNLEVKAMTTSSSIPCPFMENDRLLDDLEEHLVEIRKSQALNLLMASLTSNEAAFTRSLSHLLWNWKCQRCIPFRGLLGRKKIRHRKKKEKEDKESEKEI
ncbi:hypothetical protein JHK82_051339 [Glycine max]|nr:hypothetical protein JHK85_052040 [Glycine max]KAG5092561.1 hypothetical protein JHK82_051339 [Glycine max]